MTAQEKTVTCITIRAAYDALTEILGENTCTMILRGAGLERIIGNPPSYSWDREFTNKEQTAIVRETVNLVGAVGSQGVLRQMGYKGVGAAVEKFGVLDSIKGLPEVERFSGGLEIMRSALNRGKTIDGANGFAALDVFDCLMCEGVQSKKPYCSHYAGSIQFLADWVFGKGKYQARETKCKALGDDTCLFEIEER